MKFIRTFGEPGVVFGALLLLPMVLVINWWIEDARRYDAAYAHLFDDLRLKSKAHLNLVDYYQNCIAQRPMKTSRIISSPICIEKTKGWAEKLKMSDAVNVVINDIAMAESKAYLATKR